MLRLPSAGDGVLIFDATGFAKQGKCSVGVARQDSGTLGKTGNSQVTVNCHYAERTIAWPVATRLYLPKDWASDADRRTKAKVPEELLDQAKAWGVRWACVTADADYGDNPKLPRRPGATPPASRGRRPRRLRRGTVATRRADVLVQAQAARSWRSVAWREGSKGWMRGRFIALRGWRVTSSGGGVVRAG